MGYSRLAPKRLRSGHTPFNGAGDDSGDGKYGQRVQHGQHEPPQPTSPSHDRPPQTGDPSSAIDNTGHNQGGGSGAEAAP